MEEFDFSTKVVSSVWWRGGESGFMVGKNGVKEIQTVELPGPSAMLRWLKVVHTSGRYTLVNLQTVETVEYKDE
jgi:hypothetical protein